jgi:hypothetical protein
MSSSNVSVPGEMWVKYSTGQAILVSTLGCTYVTQFIDAVKAKLPNELGSIDPHRITLHIHENAESLRPGLRLSLLHEQAGYSGNDDEHTLIVKATGMLCRAEGRCGERSYNFDSIGGVDRYLETDSNHLEAR